MNDRWLLGLPLLAIGITLSVTGLKLIIEEGSILLSSLMITGLVLATIGLRYLVFGAGK